MDEEKKEEVVTEGASEASEEVAKEETPAGDSVETPAA